MTSTYPESDHFHGPPRLLIWFALVFIVAVLLAVIGVFLFATGGGRLGVTIPFVAVAAIILPVVSIGSALLLRKGLPRRMWLWLVVLWGVIALGGIVGGVFFFRDSLEPRYQAELLNYAPFMRQFMRPTPAGGVVPTSAAAVNNPISPEDLLNMTVGTATPQPEATGETTAQPTPEPSATLAPSSTPTPSPQPTEAALVSTAETALVPVSVPTLSPLASQAASLPTTAFMYGFRWERQEWNNCGPTNITIALSHFGWQENQNYAQQFLRPNAEDKNVSPIELVNFVNTQTGVRAITRIGGDMLLLKTLIANNFPVLVETTFTPEGSDWLGHYQTVVGYDDSSRNFFVYDSYLGTGNANNGVPEPYEQFDRDWQAFNRVFIVLYEQSREAELIGLLGPLADVDAAAERALEVARQEAQADPTSPFPWFNMGTALVRLGEYEQAAAAYDAATQRQLPFRMLWYQFGPFEAYFNIGRYDDVMGLVRNNIINAGSFIEETYYWEGRVHAARGDIGAATASFQRALNNNPLFTQAQDALNDL